MIKLGTYNSPSAQTKLEGEKTLDVEWIELITEAKRLGLTPQEVKQYLKEASSNENYTGDKP